MKIAILANVPVWTLPSLGHLRHTRHYATWLESLIPEFEDHEGFEIHWVTMCQETDEDIVHGAFGQTFHILSRKSMGKQMVSGYVGEIRRIRKVLRKIQPDVVHAWGSEDVYGLAGAFSGNRNRLFTLQGCLSEYLRLLGGSFLFRLQTFYEKPMIRRYEHATAESPSAVDFLKAINPKLEIHLVDYGVNQEFHDAVWEPDESPQLLFVGSLSDRKGIRDLIAVASRAELSGIRFKIAGEGELRTELEKISPPNVEWLGKCSRDKVIRHLTASWALVIPTYSDTGPTVIKEARAVGLPIVTTTGAGASSYVEEGKCGHVIKPGDQHALAAGILNLSSARNQATKTGKRSWVEQKKMLHPSTTARKFLEIYHRLDRKKP